MSGPWNSPEQYIVQNILNGDNAAYPDFVTALGKNVSDPKFVNAIKLLSAMKPVATIKMNVPVYDLLPTQNEIDMDKSLGYPLKDAATASKYLYPTGPISVANNNIITSNNGKYIIDGHHRWSQVYVLNPKAVITALDLDTIHDPFVALKSTQLGIGANTGGVPTAQVKGINLITVDEGTFYDYVIKTIQPAVIDVFIPSNSPDYKKSPDDKKKLIAGYIWSNILTMRKFNAPIPNAPSRNFMPQTDAVGWQNFVPELEGLPLRYTSKEVYLTGNFLRKGNENQTYYRRH